MGKVETENVKENKQFSSALFPSLHFLQQTSEVYAGKRVREKMPEKVKVGRTLQITQKEREGHSEQQEPPVLPPSVAFDLEVTAMCQ